MQDIADEAGINKALLHYYFRNKETLFGVILTEAMGKLIPRISGILEKEGPLTDKIRAFIHAYISMAMENPFLPLFVLNSLQTGGEDGISARFKEVAGKIPFQKFRELIDQAIHDGEIRNIDPQQLIMHIMSLCLFPFVARPAFEMIGQMGSVEFDHALERRKSEVAEFVIASLQPFHRIH